MTLIDVILPLPLNKTYTYALAPNGQAAQAGVRAVVPLGGKRTYTGVVCRVHSAEASANYKEAIEVLDAEPVVQPLQLRLWQWIADYYQCTLGEVMKAALPAKLKQKKAPPNPPKGGQGSLTNAGVTQGSPPSGGLGGALNPFQQKAYEEIQAKFATKDTVLLHGVTSSGKTEIYTHLIQETLRQGKQALYLLPEIALTAQITNRLHRVFGDRLSVYHSKFTDTQRVAVWNRLLEGSPQVVLGVRSSVLLPFSNLGLVIVDEEHEPSYKQYDPAPRYHARDTAIVLAALHHAKTLLGTATPALETYRNALAGKYALVELTRRHSEGSLPEILVADVREARRKKQMKLHFTPLLLEKMQAALNRGEQIILFQNRRGFAPLVECKQCAWIPRCRHCDVSLTYHKAIHKLTCHYCGANYPVPAECPNCGSRELEQKGFGTEQVEEEVQSLFPQARVARMDLDTTRRRDSHADLIDRLERGEIDVLVGTQMLAKGLDFARVSVVGILNADTMLNYPDFRAHERAFQLMAQVGGRAGRAGSDSVVVVQTANPEHPVIRQVKAHDYRAMYDMQVAEREQFGYPPFTRLLEISLKHASADKTAQAAEGLARVLRALPEKLLVLGPDNPPVPRIQNLCIKHLLVKFDNRRPVAQVKVAVRCAAEQFLAASGFKSVHLAFDIDPM